MPIRSKASTARSAGSDRRRRPSAPPMMRHCSDADSSLRRTSHSGSSISSASFSTLSASAHVHQLTDKQYFAVSYCVYFLYGNLIVTWFPWRCCMLCACFYRPTTFIYSLSDRHDNNKGLRMLTAYQETIHKLLFHSNISLMS